MIDKTALCRLGVYKRWYPSCRCDSEIDRIADCVVNGIGWCQCVPFDHDVDHQLGVQVDVVEEVLTGLLANYEEKKLPRG